MHDDEPYDFIRQHESISFWVNFLMLGTMMYHMAPSDNMKTSYLPPLPAQRILAPETYACVSFAKNVHEALTKEALA